MIDWLIAFALAIAAVALVVTMLNALRGHPMRWFPHVRLRELPPSEAAMIGLSADRIWQTRELCWRHYGLVLWASPVRRRYD